MPPFGSSPYAPKELYDYSSGPDSRISELILAAGEARARAQQRQGELLGSMVSNLGQQAGEAIQVHQEQKKHAAREAAWSDYLDNGEWHTDPLDAYKSARRIWGDEEGPKHFEGLMAVQKLAQGEVKTPEKAQEYLGHTAQTAAGMSDEMLANYWPALRGAVQGFNKATGAQLDIGETYDPAIRPQIHEFAKQFQQAQKGEAFTLGRGQVRFGPTGEKIAEGLPEEAKPDTRSLDARYAEAIASGDQAAAQQLLRAKAQLEAAGRAPAAPSGGPEVKRLDRSFEFNSGQLEAVRKPLRDQTERFNRLMTTVNERSPQADALIAPELLTVMAGGTGSGLRMNEAEISRLVNGRSNLESIKANLMKWQTDPQKALGFTDAQRAQVKSLLGTMQKRIEQRNAAINAANHVLSSPKSTVEDHRRAMSELQDKLSDVQPEEPSYISSDADAGEPLS